MRPPPTARHLAAIAILVVASGLFAFLAMHETRISAEQVHQATIALKEHDQGLFATDRIYGGSGLWQLSSPIFQSLLRMSLVPTGYSDVVLPFRLMTGLVALVYLCGMYALLFQQCRSWSISLFVALISASVLEGIEGLRWGFGSLEMTNPESMCLATLPLVLLAYLRYERKWQIVWVFAGLGVLGNLSLTTSLNLIVVFAGLYLARHSYRPKAIGTVAMSLAAAFVGASPYLGYVVWLRSSMAGGGGGSYDAAEAVIAMLDADLLYPRVLTKLLNWQLLVMLLSLGLPSLLVLVRVERYRLRHQGVWLWLMASALVVGFGAHGLSQVLAKWMDVPPILNFLDALKLALIPLFVLLAQAVTNLFRLAPRQRPLLQWVCAIVIVAWIGPADNLRVARYALWDTATRHAEEANKPRSVQRHRYRAARHAELAAIGDWVRKNTPPEALVITEDAEFRLMSRRSIVTSRDDWPYYYYAAPGWMEEWMDVWKATVSSIYADEEDRGNAIRQLIDREAFEGVTSWYLVLTGPSTAQPLGAGLKEVKAASWGSHYRIFRVRRVDLPRAEGAE